MTRERKSTQKYAQYRQRGKNYHKASLSRRGDNCFSYWCYITLRNAVNSYASNKLLWSKSREFGAKFQRVKGKGSPYCVDYPA